MCAEIIFTERVFFLSARNSIFTNFILNSYIYKQRVFDHTIIKNQFGQQRRTATRFITLKKFNRYYSFFGQTTKTIIIAIFILLRSFSNFYTSFIRSAHYGIAYIRNVCYPE